MRKVLLVIAALAVAMAPVQALSVVEGDTEIGIGIGAGVPIGNFGDVADPGFVIGASTGYYLSPNAALGVEVVFNHFPVTSELEAFLSAFIGAPVDASYRVLQLIGYGKFPLVDGNFAPYVKVCAGLYSLGAKVEALGVSDTESESKFGFGGGLGGQFKGEGRVGGFVEFMLHSILTEGESAN
jgi:hypothetical protein